MDNVLIGLKLHVNMIDRAKMSVFTLPVVKETAKQIVVDHVPGWYGTRYDVNRVDLINCRDSSHTPPGYVSYEAVVRPDQEEEVKSRMMQKAKDKIKKDISIALGALNDIEELISKQHKEE